MCVTREQAASRPEPTVSHIDSSAQQAELPHDDPWPTTRALDKDDERQGLNSFERPFEALPPLSSSRPGAAPGEAGDAADAARFQLSASAMNKPPGAKTCAVLAACCWTSYAVMYTSSSSRTVCSSCRYADMACKVNSAFRLSVRLLLTNHLSLCMA